MNGTRESGAAGAKVRERVAIGLGSNLGPRAEHLEAAVAALRGLPGFTLERVSRWHETEPEGGPPGQPRFLNGAAVGWTSLAPEALLEVLSAIERARGRRRDPAERNAPRTLDLDLLVQGARVLDGPKLVLPHPRLAQRRFVLAPLAEIAPDLRVPPRGERVVELLEALEARGPLAHEPGRREADTPRSAGDTALASLDEPAAAATWCAAARARGATIGFVPTMGALHAGHAALVRRAAHENDLAVVSIFVNPLQFDDPEDLARYPRDPEGDRALVAAAGGRLVFTGRLDEFFPEHAAGRADDAAAVPRVDPGPAAAGLEGAFRRGHFEGVATIVRRLFDLVRPTRAYFGAKDYQQTLVVRHLVPPGAEPEVVVCPTVREPDGLALSSRNRRLAPAARAQAVCLSQALAAARAAWSGGERDPERLCAAMRAVLAVPGIELEYAEVRDPERWSAARPAALTGRARALVAAVVGGIRLIDNRALDDESLAAEEGAA